MAGHTPLDTDRAHLLHPLHHPSAYAKARVWVSGKGAVLTDSTGREYIDGLSGLWNVNVGHGRKELGEAARTQMGTLAFASAYAGATNERAIELVDRYDERGDLSLRYRVIGEKDSVIFLVRVNRLGTIIELSPE